MKERGFTLIETIVALAVFGIVVSIAVNSFIGGLEVQRRSLALQKAQNELRAALESMSREIRMSHVVWPLSNPAPLIIIQTFPDNEMVNYNLSASIPKRILRRGIPFTSGDVEIKDMFFHVTNGGRSPSLVTITINAETTGTYAGQKIDLETTVSTRDYEIR